MRSSDLSKGGDEEELYFHDAKRGVIEAPRRSLELGDLQPELEADTEVWYQMTDYYQPGLGGGMRWDDPALGIDWPLAPTTMNERDATYPDLNRDDFELFRGVR